MNITILQGDEFHHIILMIYILHKLIF